MFLSTSLVYGLALTGATNALTINTNSTDSIKTNAKIIAKPILDLYDGRRPESSIGVFLEPYYWFSSGLVWDALVDYWYLTGDTTYNDIVSKALLAQVGSNNNYMPVNQTKTEGNSDQAFWALAAMSAAERQFPAPSANASWLKLASNVFDTQVARWDDSSCNGGLRWQIFSFSNGYNYKNSESNGQFFQLAARLAKYTGNQTYANWANKSYDWLASVGLLGTDGAVYDGTDVTAGCSAINRIQWTENAGFLIYGSALMYNITGSSTWSDRVTTILKHTTSTFFKNGTMSDVACEPARTCNIDQTFFKGILARDLARTTRAAPFTAATIGPLLRISANSAAASCTGENNICALSWVGPNGTFSDYLGSQYSVLEVVQANLISGAGSLATTNTTANPGTIGNGTTGGTSAPRASGASSVVGTAVHNWICLAVALFFVV